MKRNIFLFFTIYLGAVSTPLGGYSQTSRKPNILIIVADDLTFSDIQPYGSKQVHTPNIEQLAKEGLCMDNMFTSTAMCNPSRQQFMTGLFPVRNGAYPNHSYVYKNTRSIAHYMKDLGYQTGLLGKKHFGPEESFPYDYLGGRDGDEGKGQDIDLGLAEKYIQKAKNQPFFLMVTSNQPHVPWTRGNPAAYPPSKIKLPPGFEDTPLTRQNLAKYFAEVTYLDSLVGECLNILDRNGKKENTLVIFTTEQGSQMPFAKWTCYDQGLKTGFIVRWPGKVTPGTRTNALVQYVDVTPTLVEIGGGSPSKINTGTKDAIGATGFDGRSFLDVLNGKNSKFRDYVYGVQTSRGIINGAEAYGIRSIRNTEYLYIRNLNYKNTFSSALTASPLFKQWKNKNPEGRAKFYEQRPEEELYDVKKDPYQLNNLAGNTAYSKVMQELRSGLASFMKQQGDEGDITEMKAKERQIRGAEKH